MRQLAARTADQVRRSRRPLVAAILPATAIVVVAAVATRILDIPIQDAMGDPLARLGAHPLLGFVSNLGILLWAAAAGACLVGALGLRHERDADRVEQRTFFAASAALTTLLVLDDMFQLHEDLVPSLLGRGQTFILLGYVVLVGVYLWRFRRLLATTEWALLAAAGAGFAISIGMDVLPLALSYLPGGLGIDTESAPFEFVEHLLEDGAKLVGIALWLAFYLRTAGAMLAPSPAHHRAGTG